MLIVAFQIMLKLGKSPKLSQANRGAKRGAIWWWYSEAWGPEKGSRKVGGGEGPGGERKT